MKPLHVFLVAGELSGDHLGAGLMQALRDETQGQVRFSGVGGPAMEAQGLDSLFPLSDIAVMGLVPVLKRLPQILLRISETAGAITSARPDVLVLIDSPDFTHRVARRARSILPQLRVVDYVSPSVWAWRPGRARQMRRYIDHVLALLPFEPAAYRRLHGPPCTYVGHSLIERLDSLRPSPSEAAHRDQRNHPTIVLLPGSRRLEIDRLLDDFRDTCQILVTQLGPMDFVLPAVDHLADMIAARVETWSEAIRPRLVRGEAAKYAAFRQARAALAASGTVTLELALSGVPMVVAYKVSRAEEWLKYLIKVSSIVLPNLVLEEKAFPEYLQADCTPQALAEALAPLISGGAERERQLAACARLDKLMRPDGQAAPARHAARIVLDVAQGS